MSETRDFHISDVLSITTGHLVSSRHIEGVYDILNWMTGDNLYTHQLPRAFRECRPHLLAQHPQLAQIDASGVNPETWQSWLSEQTARYGTTFAVAPIPAEAHEQIDPVAEAIAMMGGDDRKVIAIEVEDTD